MYPAENPRLQREEAFAVLSRNMGHLFRVHALDLGDGFSDPIDISGVVPAAPEGL